MCQLSDGDWSHFSSEHAALQRFRLQRQMHCLVPHYPHSSLSPSLCHQLRLSVTSSMTCVRERSTLVYIWPLISPQQAFTCKCSEQGWIWGCNISDGCFTSSIFARFIIESTLSWKERQKASLGQGSWRVKNTSLKGTELCSMCRSIEVDVC